MSGSKANDPEFVDYEWLSPFEKTEVELLLETWKEDTQNQLNKLKNAMEKGNRAEANDAAHQMKSSCGMVGATKLSNVCKEIMLASSTSLAPAKEIYDNNDLKKIFKDSGELLTKHFL